MRLCMFHPTDRPMERGWVGRIDDGVVVHLAAQTLQSFFTGGGTAREHAEYPHADVRLLAPVLHPPAVRLFDSAGSFSFANPAAIVGPGETVPAGSSGRLLLVPRLTAFVGADGRVGGFTALAEWRDPSRRPPKDRDFALGLGPSVCTVDALDPDGLGSLVLVAGGLELTGAFTGFMMQRGRMVICGNAGKNLGDSMYDGTIYIAGEPQSLGVDAVWGSMTDLDRAWLERKLRLYDLLPPAGAGAFRKIVAGKQLWNYDNLEPTEKKLVL